MTQLQVPFQCIYFLLVHNYYLIICLFTHPACQQSFVNYNSLPIPPDFPSPFITCISQNSTPLYDFYHFHTHPHYYPSNHNCFHSISATPLTTHPYHQALPPSPTCKPQKPNLTIFLISKYILHVSTPPIHNSPPHFTILTI